MCEESLHHHLAQAHFDEVGVDAIVHAVTQVVGGYRHSCKMVGAIIGEGRRVALRGGAEGGGVVGGEGVIRFLEVRHLQIDGCCEAELGQVLCDGCFGDIEGGGRGEWLSA